MCIVIFFKPYYFSKDFFLQKFDIVVFLLTVSSLEVVDHSYADTNAVSLECAIHAMEYEWYRVTPHQREFIRNGSPLTISEVSYTDQGLYICIGRRGGIYANETVEHQLLLTLSGKMCTKSECLFMSAMMRIPSRVKRFSLLVFHMKIIIIIIIIIIIKHLGTLFMVKPYHSVYKEQ